MAGVAAGVVSAADVNSQSPTQTPPLSPSTWAWVWFGAAILYLIGVYSGQIRIARER